MKKMTRELLYYDGQANINTFEEYPRYLAYNEADESVFIDEGTPEVKKSALDFIKSFFLKLLSFNRKILDLIFFWKK